MAHNTRNRRPRTPLAPLSEDLAPEQREFLDPLRQLFTKLDVSVQRYASRHHISASAVSRYLSGKRTMQWSFVADLLAELREVGEPVTDEVARTLRELHRRACLASSRTNEVERLRFQLAEADERARNAELTERALAEQLRDETRHLEQLQRRLHELDRERQAVESTHHEALVYWTDACQRLREERDALRERVRLLREALWRAQQSALASEERCARLEEELEEAENRPVSAGSLMEMLENSDLTAPVPELVSLVNHWNTPARRTMAMEVVKSAACTRPVRDGAALIEALYAAGQHRHAEAALPAMVAGRPPMDTVELVAAFTELGRDEPAALVLTQAVHLHPAHDVAAVATRLHRLGHVEQATVLLGSAASVWESLDVVALLDALPSPDGGLAEEALRVCGRERRPGEVATLVKRLWELAPAWYGDLLLDSVAQRPAPEVVQVLVDLRVWADPRIERVLRLSTDSASVGHTAAMICALQGPQLTGLATWLVTRSVRIREPEDTSGLIADLHSAGRGQFAILALTESARGRSVADFGRMIMALETGTHRGVVGVLQDAAGGAAANDLAVVARCLELSGHPQPARELLWQVVRRRTPGQAVHFVGALRQHGSATVSEEGLRPYATLPPADVAALVGVLEAAGMPDRAADLLAGARAAAAGPPELVALLAELRKELPARSARRWMQTVLEGAAESEVTARVEFFLAVEESPLLGTETATWYEDAVRWNGRRGHREFKQALQKVRKARHKERTRIAARGIRSDRKHRRQAARKKLTGIAGGR